jgi:hypothetical protein
MPNAEGSTFNYEVRLFFFSHNTGRVTSSVEFISALCNTEALNKATKLTKKAGAAHFNISRA